MNGTTLLRQSYREGSKVRHRTLANLSHLPEATVVLVRASLAGNMLRHSFASEVVAATKDPALVNGYSWGRRD